MMVDLVRVLCLFTTVLWNKQKPLNPDF